MCDQSDIDIRRESLGNLPHRHVFWCYNILCLQWGILVWQLGSRVSTWSIYNNPSHFPLCHYFRSLISIQFRNYLEYFYDRCAASVISSLLTVFSVTQIPNRFSSVSPRALSLFCLTPFCHPHPKQCRLLTLL